MHHADVLYFGRARKEKVKQYNDTRIDNNGKVINIHACMKTLQAGSP